MSKYKFVVYEKLDKDAHTTRMLEEKHHGNIPEEITDKQLSSNHVGIEELTMEKLLDESRTGSAEVILEKNLDDAKNEYGSNHRDSSTYEGNISKLEEKRLASDNIEEEKYESASETPKKSRWWEVKSEDGLKIAYKKKAQVDDYLQDVDWNYLERDRTLDMEDDFDIDRMEDDFPIDEMDVDFQDYNIDEMDKDIEIKETYYKEEDIGGTPTASGTIRISGIEFVDSPSDIEEELRDFMSLHHSSIPFSMTSFDFSDMKSGIITYQSGVGDINDEVGSNIEEVRSDEAEEVEEDFDITTLASSKKK